RLVGQVSETLERYRFAEQVKIVSRTDDLHEIALHGRGADAVLSELLAAPLFEDDIVVWRDDPTGSPGAFMIVPVVIARRVWMVLISRFGSDEDRAKRRLRPIGWAAFNATRIEAGRPIFGIDFD